VENVFIGVPFCPNEVHTYTNLVNEFQDDFSWTYEKILDIDPRILEDKIKNYENDKSSQKNIKPVNPNNVATIKVEVEISLRWVLSTHIPLANGYPTLLSWIK